MARPVITFTSDFGTQDWFVGVVHGVLYQVCAEAHVVDLTHDLPHGDIARAAFVLEAAAPDFLPGTVHLAVVDPGVGTPRRALAVAAREQVFVGPDNGLLDWALRDPAARVHVVTDKSLFRQPLSRTFHARDVFAPVAARIACGLPLERLGPQVQDAVRLARPESRRRDETVEGQVVFVDRFGNALTNIEAADLASVFPDVPGSALEVRVLRHTIPGLSQAYGDHRLGAVVALLGSSGRLEIAQVGGHCAERLGIGEGDRVVVRKGGGVQDEEEAEPPVH
jgi:S-adenosylmethionine hydrolase